MSLDVLDLVFFMLAPFYPISDPILSAKSLGRTFCPSIKT